jgi:hypothetical protein
MPCAPSHERAVTPSSFVRADIRSRRQLDAFWQRERSLYESEKGARSTTAELLEARRRIGAAERYVQTLATLNRWPNPALRDPAL